MDGVSDARINFTAETLELTLASGGPTQLGHIERPSRAWASASPTCAAMMAQHPRPQQQHRRRASALVADEERQARAGPGRPDGLGLRDRAVRSWLR
ncbi:hypothetical protein ULF88_22665 [Halopseudomonas pachastrellae]|nr:hypothetical protein [Halopseudomonas pachastrellae]